MSRVARVAASLPTHDGLPMLRDGLFIEWLREEVSRLVSSIDFMNRDFLCIIHIGSEVV